MESVAMTLKDIGRPALNWRGVPGLMRLAH